jgi:hypothetical protein
MASEPIFEKSIHLPMDFVFTARARPSTVKRTLFMLLPWALYAMTPAGRRSRIVLSVARRISPLMRQRIG